MGEEGAEHVCFGMTYEEWEAAAPTVLKADAIWRVQAFRLASYVSVVAGIDADRIAEKAWLVKSAGQLAGASESIPANIAEGYARFSSKDRIRFYEYALGSLNETKSRYVSLSRRLAPALVEARLTVLASITRLLLKMIQSGRLLGTDEGLPAKKSRAEEPPPETTRPEDPPP